MQLAETPQCPDGEDIAVCSVTDGTRLVEHPRNVLLRERDREEDGRGDRGPRSVQLIAFLKSPIKSHTLSLPGE